MDLPLNTVSVSELDNHSIGTRVTADEVKTTLLIDGFLLADSRTEIVASIAG